MEIRVNLHLLVAVALAMLLALSAFSWFQGAHGHQSLLNALARHEKIYAVVDSARAAQVHFKTQVQEKERLSERKQRSASWNASPVWRKNPASLLGP